MTYRTDPLIPQQGESVEDVTAPTRRNNGSWTGREMVAGSDGVWHRIASPAQRTAIYRAACGKVVEAREARTLLSGDPTCRRCLIRVMA